MRTAAIYLGLLVTTSTGCFLPVSDVGKTTETSENQASDASTTPSTPANDPIATPVTPQRTEQVEARAGVAKKGRKLDDEEGIGRMIAQPAISYFATKEKLVFEVSVPHALNLYKATKGRAPKTHDEFMKEVIKPMVNSSDLSRSDVRANRKAVKDCVEKLSDE